MLSELDAAFHIANRMDEIIPGVFVGGIQASTDYDLLHDNAISYILNVSNFPLDTEVMNKYESLNIQFAQVKMEDSPYFDLRKNILAAVSTVRSAVNDNGRILVHCMAGISRSATVVAAYMIEYLGHSANSALQEMSLKQPAVYPNSGFLTFLRNLEKSIVRDLK